MRLPQFEHVAPGTLAEACAILAARGPQAVAFAGGTDLLVKMKQRKLVPQCVVSLKAIRGLDRITYDEVNGLHIGALVTIQALKNSSIVKRRCHGLAQAAAVEASVQVRNLATIGGNIANASPAADAPLALMVAGARVVLVGTTGEREVPIEDLFTGPGRTILQPGELIKEIHVPPSPARTGTAYLKHALRRTDIAIVSAAVMLTLADDGACAGVRVGLGAVAPTIMRARQAEALLTGNVITDDQAAAAAHSAAKESSPIDDIRRSARYRVQSIADVTKLAILQALQEARAGGH